MNITRDELWINNVIKGIPSFLHSMKTDIPGHFKHSFSGDIYKPSRKWGLIQTISVVKILSILSNDSTWKKFNKKQLTTTILSFEKKDGSIVDPLIYKKSILQKVKRSIRRLNLANLFYNNEVIATTRSSYNALRLLNSKPKHCFSYVLFSENEIQRIIRKLYWKNPWEAGSHFNHLLFFIQIEKDFKGLSNEKYNHYLDVALETLRLYEDAENAIWCDNNYSQLDNNIIINGIMKVCMGLNIVNRLKEIKYPEKIIDRCLNLNVGNHACDYFNVIYVLHTMLKLTYYRKSDIEKYCYSVLNIIRKNYWPDQKGFSFNKGKAEEHFYGVRFSAGLPEPDLHGTTMYLWTIALINEICDLGYKLNALKT